MAACSNNLSLSPVQNFETIPTLDSKTDVEIFDYAFNCTLDGKPVFSHTECGILAKEFKSLPAWNPDEPIVRLSEQLSIYRPTPHHFYAFSSSYERSDGKDKIFCSAVDLSTGESVALLRIKPEKAHRHPKELRIVKKLTDPADASPYIIRVLASYTLGGLTTTIMPLYSASDLYTYAGTIATKPLIWQLRTVRDILRGIKYIHKQGLIHRDIKPENVFVHLHQDSQGKIQPQFRIGDFGEAVDQHDQVELLFPAGTPYYNSPEMERQWELFETLKPNIHSPDPLNEFPPKIIAASRAITTKTDVYSVNKLIDAIFIPLTHGIAQEFWVEFQAHSPLQWEDPIKRASIPNALKIVDHHITTERTKRQH